MVPEKASPSTSPRSPARTRAAIVRIFLKVVSGAAVIFIAAAIIAPRLFDAHDDLLTVLAFALWIACPLFLFFLGWDLLAEVRKFNGDKSPL